MSYYTDIYLKRLNRYGLDYQTRTQTKREREFENYLIKSIYRVDISYNNQTIPCSFEPYKQTSAETVHYLLTRVGDAIPDGTIIQVPDKDGVLNAWMIWWREVNNASGYNRYIALQMTAEVTIDDVKYPCHFYGPGSSKIKDTLKSSSKGTEYTEDENLSMLIMPVNSTFVKDAYIEIPYNGIINAFTISGIDMLSNPGVEYISLDPVYVRNKEENPTKSTTDSDEDFFWFNGGAN